MRDGIVRRVAAGERETGERDGLPGRDLLRGKAGRGAGGDRVHRVAADDAHQGEAREVRGRGKSAVVDFVRRRHAGHREGLRGNIGRRGRLRDGVVRRVAAGERETGDRDGLAGRDLLRGKAGRGGGGDRGHRVAADDADQGRIREVRRRGGRARVDFARRRDTDHREVLGRDVGGRGRLREDVVGGIGPGEGEPGDLHRLAEADRLRGEGSGRAGPIERDDIADDHAL